MLAIRAGRSRFTLQTLPENDFPDLAAGDMTHSFTLAAPDMKRLIDRTQFAISTEETRYYLNGIYLHASLSAEVDVLRAVATDGHRLARVDVPLPEGAKGMPGVIVPRKTVGEVQRLIEELNGFGEDTAPFLIASMYRHLAYWPPYLALIRTLLAPLQSGDQLIALTSSARALGRAHGRALVSRLVPGDPPASLEALLASCRLFVEHPIARMTGICALIRRATPE